MFFLFLQAFAWENQRISQHPWSGFGWSREGLRELSIKYLILGPFTTLMENNNLFDFGMIGLGTMGRNLLLNMADHGFKAIGFDKDLEKGKLLE